MPERLFLTPVQAIAEARTLVVLAEARLQRGEVAAAGEAVAELRALEDQFGAETLFGGEPDLADRFDAAVQAWKEARPS